MNAEWKLEKSTSGCSSEKLRLCFSFGFCSFVIVPKLLVSRVPSGESARGAPSFGVSSVSERPARVLPEGKPKTRRDIAYALGCHGAEAAFDDKRKSSENLATFSREAGEASFSELFGVIEQPFLELFGAFPVIERTLSQCQL